MTLPIATLAIHSERDVVLARQRTRQIADLLGFDPQDQTRLATAVSEIARNASTYAREGKIEFHVEGATVPQLLQISISDRGPGIAQLENVLEGRYHSRTGMGVGILGARRLMDRFDIKSGPGGTTVALRKFIPRKAGLVGPEQIARVAQRLAQLDPLNPLEELQRQNQELLHALEELNKRQEELAALNRELEDTNRGVVALYAELDEKADHLRRADELKSRFLSNMSHEFRTPVNSIQALARMLLERTDGDLTSEQERQVMFIRRAADGLGELVNDLLDLAKVEAGKTVVRPVEFDLDHLFGALRGMLRPLLVNESVVLVFDAADEIPSLYTDEAKVSQILRNFISNALKFTERGEVRVAACLSDDRREVQLTVADTGIGIAPADQERIFQEFTQIDSPIQRRVQGTGLGLPLCRRLAELLGGSVGVASTPGIGSTFSVTIPLIYEAALPEMPDWGLDADRKPVLVVENNPETLLQYEKMFHDSALQFLPARNLREAREALAQFQPQAIVLDIMLGGEDAWAFLAELKRRPDTQAIPIAVISAVEDVAKAFALGADAYCAKPIDRQTLLQTLARLIEPESVKRILIVDDEEICRYVLRQHLALPQHIMLEAVNGAEALRLARAERPDLICLDLMMPDVDGYEVLRQLKAESETESIPVIICSSKPLGETERTGALAAATGFLPKDQFSRDQVIAAVQLAMRTPEEAG